MSRKALEQVYQSRVKKPSDINEHLPVLRNLVTQNSIRTVVELGVRDGNSTLAFLTACPDRVLSVDIVDAPFLWEVRDAYRALPDDFLTQWEYLLADDLTIEISQCDLLFIDTNHTYKQLSQELRKHGDKAVKFIVLHDTTTFRDWDAGWNEEGLGRAVDEFVAQGVWRIQKHYTNCNGLTILNRVSSLMVQEVRPISYSGGAMSLLGSFN